MLPAWPGGGRQNRLSPLDGDWVAWRVVGGNHRELARSAVVFADATAAGQGIALVQGGADRAPAGIETVCGRWAWQLSIDGASVAVSSRLYQRSRECSDSLATALAAFKVAEFRDLVPRTRRLHPRVFRRGRARWFARSRGW